jgi:hypothetical protein
VPNYIASYDLEEAHPDPHLMFLEKAIEHGWTYWIQAKNDRWYRLPNTTLVGSFNTLDEAVAALKAARAATEAEIGRRVNIGKVDSRRARYRKL